MIKYQNIHILALNLHLLISLFLLFCSILFPFYVFCVFVGHGRKESVFGKDIEDVERMWKGLIWNSSIGVKNGIGFKFGFCTSLGILAITSRSNIRLR
jgi:hypothetical protein